LPGAAADLPAQQPSRQVHLLVDARAARGAHLQYDGAVSVSASGPNALCDSAPILPLTESKSAVHDAIGQMRAKGSTNMLEGLMWGWRVLSPEEPFTHGRPYSDRENTSI
jgi:hypothetical protein